MPSFFPDSRGSILGLSFDEYFVTEFLWKGVENFRNIKRGQMYMEDPVYDTMCNL